LSAANQEPQSSSDALPFRQGALSAEEIREECPQFRILIIGKANAGKTTILRKVCNAKPDVKPIVYDAEGEEVILVAREEVRVQPPVPQEVQRVPTKVQLGNLAVLAQTNE
jgi:GTPase SAR1 family protein